MKLAAAVPRATFDILAALLRSRAGIVIGPDKSYLLESRLAPVLRRWQLRDLPALAARLCPPGDEGLVDEFVEAMTTNETSFFRDGAPFRHFRDIALPRLHRSRAAGQKLRVWSAAAAAGQEAYSAAMVVAQCRVWLGDREVEILGTDIARGQIARAQEGRYSQFEAARGLSERQLARHFRSCPDGWQAQDELRAAVTFRPWNLLDDPRSLGHFDVIFCRNVLIYFDPPTRARVIGSIVAGLAAEGVLYLGSAETVSGVAALAPDGGVGIFRRLA